MIIIARCRGECTLNGLEVSRQEKRKWRPGCGTGSMQDFQQMKSVEIWTISTLMGINKPLFPPILYQKQNKGGNYAALSYR
jgi:hypothetical protein